MLNRREVILGGIGSFLAPRHSFSQTSSSLLYVDGDSIADYNILKTDRGYKININLVFEIDFLGKIRGNYEIRTELDNDFNLLKYEHKLEQNISGFLTIYLDSKKSQKKEIWLDGLTYLSSIHNKIEDSYDKRVITRDSWRESTEEFFTNKRGLETLIDFSSLPFALPYLLANQPDKRKFFSTDGKRLLVGHLIDTLEGFRLEVTSLESLDGSKKKFGEAIFDSLDIENGKVISAKKSKGITTIDLKLVNFS